MNQTTKVFNYFATANANLVRPVYTDVQIIKQVNGVTVGRLLNGSEVLIVDDIIISERLKQSDFNIKAFLNPDCKDYFLRLRPVETLQKAKEYLKGLEL